MSAPSLFIFAADKPAGSEVWQVELPLPPREASPNHHVHWRYKTGATGKVTAYRQKCARIFYAANLPKLRAPVVIHLDFYYFRGTHETHPELWHWRRIKKVWTFPFAVCRDEDNARASFKAGIDAMVDAGVIPGDTKKNLKTGYCTLHTTAKEHQGRTCVIVTIQGDRIG